MVCVINLLLMSWKASSNSCGAIASAMQRDTCWKAYGSFFAHIPKLARRVQKVSCSATLASWISSIGSYATMNRPDGVLGEEFSVRLERCVNQALACPTDSDSIGVFAHRDFRGIASDDSQRPAHCTGACTHEKVPSRLLVDNLDKAWDRNKPHPTAFRIPARVCSARHLGSMSSCVAAILGTNRSTQISSSSFARYLRSAFSMWHESVTRLSRRGSVGLTPELLVRVIEERFTSAFDDARSPAQLSAEILLQSRGDWPHGTTLLGEPSLVHAMCSLRQCSHCRSREPQTRRRRGGGHSGCRATVLSVRHRDNTC